MGQTARAGVPQCQVVDGTTEGTYRLQEEPGAQGVARLFTRSQRAVGESEHIMGGKNKGGREVRKPKQPKSAKAEPSSGIVPPATKRAGGR